MTEQMRARFSGLPSELLPDNPDLDETLVFVVTATCKKHVEEQMSNGERRRIANFTVNSIQKAGDKKPINPEQDFEDEPLFDTSFADDDGDGAA